MFLDVYFVIKLQCKKQCNTAHVMRIPYHTARITLVDIKGPAAAFSLNDRKDCDNQFEWKIGICFLRNSKEICTIRAIDEISEKNRMLSIFESALVICSHTDFSVDFFLWYV